MKIHHYIVLVSLLSAFPLFAENASPPDSVLKALLSAVETNSVEKFIADGDTQFKAAMTKEILAPVSAQISSRLKSGYTTSYLGKLHQQGFDVHLYRLAFKDGGDDVLAKLSLKDGKVGGFWLQ